MEARLNTNITQKSIQIAYPVGLNIEVRMFIEKYIGTDDARRVLITSNDFNEIEQLPKALNAIVNLEKVNNIRYNNKFYEAINQKLVNGGIFIGSVETYAAFRHRKKINRIPIIRYFYFLPVFIFRRIIPKLWGLKRIFYGLTKGNNRLISKAETLGRLVSCGFEILNFETINGLLYFVVVRERAPSFDMHPSYGPFFKMLRIGKGNQIIGVYKLRTMHPYSEYLQDFVLQLNGYAKTGKPADDFRIPSWSRFFRKYWLDELPQLINVLKGEMKLVGVRPVSERYYRDLPEEIKQLRYHQKPGCIPPYVALNRKSNVAEVLKAELEYLKAYKKDPWFTDIKYFFSAIINIVFRGKRSA